jgi:nitroreductase
MFEHIGDHHSGALDDIIRARRTVRAFSPAIPGREEIEAIIRAGLLAPFGALAVAGRPDFRKIIVIPGSSPAMAQASEIMKKRMGIFAGELERKVGAAPFVENIKRAARQGIPGVGNAPYFIVVAERKGMPPVAAQSISYCLQNMWLKATSLGIGFQLVSATTQMEADPEFCRLSGLPCGEYALDGCALGYPADTYRPQDVAYPAYDKSVAWL